MKNEAEEENESSESPAPLADAEPSAPLEETELPAQPTPRHLTRRHWMLAVASLLGGLIGVSPDLMALIPQSTNKTDDTRPQGKPRYKYKQTPSVSYQLKRNVEEGFYFRERKTPLPVSAQSQKAKPRIFHYVDANGRMPFVEFIVDTQLNRADDASFLLKEQNKSLTSSPHVHFARASAIFEIVALKQIQQLQYDKACQLLLSGIIHDLAFKSIINKGPSLRLFDLLATVAVRHDQKSAFDQLQQLAAAASKLIDLQHVGPGGRHKRPRRDSASSSSQMSVNVEQFEKRHLAVNQAREKRRQALSDRIKKWNDPNSKWQIRVKTTQPLLWHVTLPLNTNQSPQMIKIMSFAVPTIRRQSFAL